MVSARGIRPVSYDDLPDDAFWKLCRERADHWLSALYKPRFPISSGDRVATAGSCFAQHFGAWVQRSDLRFMNVEPKSKHLDDAVARQFGYGTYSARYGNIYTVRQLHQLIADCQRLKVRECAIWERDGRWYDGLRPQIEPQGFRDREELIFHRKFHLSKVRELFALTDVFVFTLGLTEAWLARKSGTVFPMAPGVVAGRFDPRFHGFVNFTVDEVIADLNHVVRRLKRFNKRMRILLTVSPVPLTATASGSHVALATTYSKSVLRVAAAEVMRRFENVDYVPSYEIITNPLFGSRFYDDNLRTVTQAGVQTVMSTFFGAHSGVTLSQASAGASGAELNPAEEDNDLICEEVLLEAFARQ